MRVDPRSCECEVKGYLGWALLHDILVHPLLGLTLYRANWVIKLHDYTSHKAWPRPAVEPLRINGITDDLPPPDFMAAFQYNKTPTDLNWD